MDTVNNKSRWLLALGISTIVLAAFAVIMPLHSNLTFEIFVGLIFISAGLGHALYAFWSRAWGGFYFQLFGATHYILIGLMLLANPSLGLQGIMLLLALLFILQGMVQFALASEPPDDLTKNWILLSATVAVALGFFIWLQWPSNAYWLIGLFVSIHLLLRGLSLVFFARAAYRLGHWCAAIKVTHPTGMLSHIE